MAGNDRRPECAVVIALFLGLALLFFSLRMYVKAFLTKGWGFDDLLLIIGVCLFITYSVCAAIGVHYGTGRHLDDIPESDIPIALRLWFLCEIFYALTTLFVRLSIAAFIIRICPKRGYRIVIYTTMTMVTVFTIFYFFLVLFQCSPVDYFWNQYRGLGGRCINPGAVPDASIAHSAVSFTSDWILCLLPIGLIYNLQMNQRTKISLACILAIGLLAGIAAMIRIPYIKTLTITEDFLYATTDVALWSTVEAGLGIVAASAYTLRPLFRSLFGPSRAAPSYPSTKAPTGAGYPNNHNTFLSRPSRTAQPSESHHLGIPLRQSAEADAYSNGNANSSRSPFGDSNEDVSQRRAEGESEGIQVHRTFEVRSGHEDANAGWDMMNVPGRKPGSSRSDVSIV